MLEFVKQTIGSFGMVAWGAISRSPLWPKVRLVHLKTNPCCAACGTKLFVEVHHKVPVHVNKSLELEPSNFITLCRTHHLLIGHLGSWFKYNKHVVEDAATYKKRLDEYEADNAQSDKKPAS